MFLVFLYKIKSTMAIPQAPNCLDMKKLVALSHMYLFEW